jgi:hypothetical protein
VTARQRARAASNASEVAACRELQRRLAEDLVNVRGQFQEAVANYSVRVQGMLAEAGDSLAGDDPARLAASDVKARTEVLREVLRDVEALSLKPARGRRRDLRAIQLVAERACEMVSDW